MKLSSMTLVAALFIGLLSLAGCGGGGGAGTGNIPNTVVSGVASKGIIKGGLVRVYALKADGSKGTLLKETTTDATGAYHADLGTYQGAVLVEASGDYVDEATGATRTISPDAPLRAALDAVSGATSIAVTPLTELAVQLGEDPVSHNLNVAEIAAHNTAVAQAFKVDILKSMPADALGDSTTATSAQKLYALVLAAVSQLMQTQGKDLKTVLADFKDALAAGQAMPVQVAQNFQTALMTFATSAANKTGITDVSGTSLINIGGTTRTLTVSVGGTSALLSTVEVFVTLPAGVTVKAAGNGVLPDTVLQFAGAASSGAIASATYAPATASARGAVHVGVVSTGGIAAGDLVTLQCDVAPGFAPAASDFLPALTSATGVSPSASLTGLQLSVQLQ